MLVHCGTKPIDSLTVSPRVVQLLTCLFLPPLLIWHLSDPAVNWAKGVNRQKTTLQKDIHLFLVYLLQLLTAGSECQCEGGRERESSSGGLQVNQLSCNMKLHPNSAVCSSAPVVRFSFTSALEDVQVF